MKIGKNLILYRKKANLSKEDVAGLLNITIETLDLWENEQLEPSLDELKKLSSLYNVTIDDICNEEDFSDALFTSSIDYNYDILVKAHNIYLAKNTIYSWSLIIGSLLLTILIFVISENKIFAIFTIFIFIFAVANLIRIQKAIKKDALITMKDSPELKSQYYFYEDYLVSIGKSQNSIKKLVKKYDEFSFKKQDEQYIYLGYDNRYIVIDKKTCDENICKLEKLLKLKNRKSINIKKLLNVFLILSFLSIMFALITVSISVEISPLPDFPFIMTEHMWKFFLFLPIPIASLVLGIIFRIYKYKCNMNIIFGCIISFLLFIFGNFTFIFSSEISHEASVLNEISNLIDFEFPKSEYISSMNEYIENSDSLIMVKFNDEEENKLLENINNNQYWKDYNLLPNDSIINIVLFDNYDYDYFFAYDIMNSNYKNGFMAYDEDKNVLVIYLK